MDPFDVARSFIDDSTRAASISALAKVFTDALEHLGFGYFACCSRVDPLQPPRRAVMLHNYPAQWVQAFSERNLHEVDPVLLHAERTLLPFFWDAREFQCRLTGPQRDILSQAASLGLAKGYTVPIHVPRTHRALQASCSVVPGSGSIDARNYLAVQLMAGHLYAAADRHIAKTTRTILIIDADIVSRRSLTPRLVEAGYQCVEAHDGESARNHLIDNRPDLILLEWTLPDTSGREYLSALKHDDRLREIPVIIVSSRTSEQDRVDGLANGADDFVPKPFSERELIARIEALLRRCATGRNEEEDADTKPISICGLRLEPLTHRVYADGKNCVIGRTEFQMLKFFLTHPDTVYSRRDLMDRLRGPNAGIDERTVDVYVRRLRQALAPFGYDKFVQTVYGSGYRFSELARE